MREKKPIALIHVQENKPIALIHVWEKKPIALISFSKMESLWTGGVQRLEGDGGQGGVCGIGTIDGLEGIDLPGTVRGSW